MRRPPMPSPRATLSVGHADGAPTQTAASGPHSSLDRRVGLLWAGPMARRVTLDTPTRDRLIQAAMDVFAERGYHGATVDDIVAASETSKGAFYHYFSSKQAVFPSLLDRLVQMVEAGVEQAIGQEAGALAKVEAALRVVLEVASARRDLP